MKASILKKLNLMIEEANAFKDKNKYQKAIDKLHEAIDFINEKVKEPEDKETEINNIKNVINQTYSVEVNDYIQQAIRLVSQKEFDKAYENFQEALKVADNIDDPDFKETEVQEVNKLNNEAKLKELIIDAVNLRENKDFDDAVETFNKGLIIAEEIYEGIPKIEEQDKIKAEIDQTCSTQIKLIIEKGNQLKLTDKSDEAINEFEKALRLTDSFYNSEQKNKEIINIKNLVNQIYSNKIKPIVDKTRELVTQNNINSAISESKNALDIANRMYDSDLKNLEISIIAEIINPFYIEKVNPIIEKGKQVTQQDKFEESTTKINEAVKIFKEALDGANSMIPDIKKDQEIKNVSDLINNACLAGINLIKENSVNNIMQKKYDDALEAINLALELDLKDINLYYMKNKALYEYGKIDEALKVVEEGLKLFPDKTKKITIHKAYLYKRQKNYDKALEIIDNLFEKNPNDIDILNNKLYYHLYKGEKEEALKAGEMLIKLDPDDGNCHDSYAEALVEFGDYEKAIEVAKKALELEPLGWFTYNTYFQLAKSYKETGEYELAKDSLQKGERATNTCWCGVEMRNEWKGKKLDLLAEIENLETKS